ncbi:DUF742 domain-containing protein [Rhizohabitans arisaemae]|uniref:DUF742 domain-containing protein n=1 Tax=Rhizohabitans arisaemae TaxID=2720610 RepID=UPI0024B15205|nr:DUF742 domain-containing protein [Rhizohabitans arisaemae]
MSEHEGMWVDEDAGPLVRPYTLTRGRARPSKEIIDLIAIVITTGVLPQGAASPEQLHILRICRRATSLAEVASELDLPLGVVRVLVSDLHDQGMVTVRPPAPIAQLPSERILREVINGLRAL